MPVTAVYVDQRGIKIIPLRKAGLLFIFLLLPVLFPLPDACANGTTIIQGKVRDSLTGKPVAAAIVSLQDFPLLRKKVRVSTASGADGAFRIESLLPGGIYRIECRVQGYRQYQGMLNVSCGRSHSYNISLFPLSRPANRAPVIKAVIPEQDTEFLVSAKVRVSVCAFDPEGGPLQYRFLVNESVAKDWGADPVYLWQSPCDRAGEFNIRCQVRDRAGLSSEKAVRCRTIQPTIEEVLNKIKLNYQGITDFSAQMRFESRTGLSRGNTVKYCRYYFKSPDKERTDTYAKPSATGMPEETLIVNAGKLIFISGSQRNEADLQGEFAEAGADINLLNICYCPEAFLSGHKVDLSLQVSDPLNLIIGLEAAPLKENALYSKLLLRVDYRRGVVMTYDIYTPVEEGVGMKLWQSIKTLKVGEFPGKIYLPVEMEKKIYFSGGTIYSRISYSQLRLNSGLNEEKFK